MSYRLLSSSNKISSLPSIGETVRAYGLVAKRNLGQNFLCDSNLLDRIARTAGSLKGNTVIEVGPGPGGLTRALLANGADKVVAIEKDKRCIEALSELQSAAGGRLEVVEADALKIDEAKFLPSPALQKIKIVANLPYNIATELLFKWLDKLHLFESLTLMFQKEVAERITAQPNSKSYGRLSVMSQWLCVCRKEFDIKPEAFLPPPKVTSSVVTLAPREQPLAPAKKELLEKICKTTFGQRRKMLKSSLKQLTDTPETALNLACVDPTMRPENLTIEQFCTLARAMEYW